MQSEGLESSSGWSDVNCLWEAPPAREGGGPMGEGGAGFSDFLAEPPQSLLEKP